MKDRANPRIIWYQCARLITVQIDLLLGCSARFAVAAIGYVAALLLVKIEKAFVRSEVGSSVKIEDRPDAARSG